MPRQLWTVSSAATELQCDRASLAKWVDDSGLEPQTVQERKNGDIREYYMSDLARLSCEKSTGKETERGPKYEEEVRRLKRENDLEESLVERLADIEAVYTPLLKRVSQVIDRIPQIASDACPAVDGRGREKMAAALIVEKNQLAKEHERIFAKSD